MGKAGTAAPETVNRGKRIAAAGSGYNRIRRESPETAAAQWFPGFFMLMVTEGVRMIVWYHGAQ